MPYRFVTIREDYARFASGGVFYHLSGLPVFPVRLLSEVFQRCLEIRRRDGVVAPCVIFDPCCGAACHLCTLACLHWNEISSIICSDIDAATLAAAESNLSLLTANGMSRRCTELSGLYDQYGKVSHAQALAHAQSLQAELAELRRRHAISTHLFQADALQPAALSAHLSGQQIDLVFADVPYGRCSQWQGVAASSTLFPVEGLLDALQRVITSRTIVAIASMKHEQIAHAAYTQIARLKLGKRMITLLKSLHA